MIGKSQLKYKKKDAFSVFFCLFIIFFNAISHIVKAFMYIIKN
ncbi:hypothetical protein [uncultured Gammaproteobacteria bacterium]|nr:hypothetical protein [uncultured Gammaproteobacteria bacterium]CAC9981212.1 hypothetical protein [uncultured Gammaproteobacteria bacterium]VVH50405.1 hypothetical protein BPUTSESOX_108 [uncultured Gammaproteobacteria bacterium]